MDRNLRRYWIRLQQGHAATSGEFGVPAYDEADALGIIRHLAFEGSAMPEVQEILADVDVRDLDQGHVIPNMTPPNWRGIWYPKGFDTPISDDARSAA